MARCWAKAVASRSALSSPPVDHPAQAQVNPDASHFVVGGDTADCVVHGQSAHASSIGSAVPLPACAQHAPCERNPQRNKSDRDHSDCKSESAYGTAHTQRSVRSIPLAPNFTPIKYRQGHSFVKYSPRTRAQHGVGHDIGVNLAVWAGVVPALLGSGLFTSSRLALSVPPAEFHIPSSLTTSAPRLLTSVVPQSPRRQIYAALHRHSHRRVVRMRDAG